jgi:DMSO/TMAO reductase YedYZ molybdopterin-dependent catalytic subunit
VTGLPSRVVRSPFALLFPGRRRPAEPPPRPEPAERERRFGRGVFLVTVVGGASSLAWGRAFWSSVSGAVSPLADVVAPFLPLSGWRIYTVSGSMPTFDPVSWRLEVGGLVGKPVTLDYRQLRALPRTHQVSTFHCVTGWTVHDVHWIGVRLSDLLAAVEPLPAAGALRFVSAENPYVDYLTLPEARLHDVLLAYGMNGKPLPREHGAPIRLVIPEMYGYKNVKWVRRIDLVASPGTGYWEARGYDADAWVGHSNGYGT